MRKPKFDLEIDTDFNRDIESAAQKLYPIFNLFGWTWWSEEGNRTPSLSELEDEIKSQVNTLLKEGRESGYFVSSGRITSRLMHDGESWYIDIGLDLETLYDKRIS